MSRNLPATPTLSVIIPCYNQAPYLRQAIDSAVEFPGAEVIVVNDGSTDDTAAIGREYGDRIVYIEQENVGLSAARNAGIARARGAWLQFLDSDDFVVHDFYHRILRESDGADVLHGSWQYVDEQGVPTKRVQSRPLEPSPYEALVSGNRFPTCSVLIRRDVVDRIGVFDPALRACEDWDLWLRAAMAGARFRCVPDACSQYRRYAGSMSTDFDRMLTAGMAVLDGVQSTPGLTAEQAAAAGRARGAWRAYCVKRLRQGYADQRPGTRLRLLAMALRTDPLVSFSLVRSLARRTRTLFSVSRHGDAT